MPYSGYPTPDTPGVAAYTTRCITIPDIPEFVALIPGLLFEATRPGFWRELGTMTPQEAADLMAIALGLYDAEAECEGTVLDSAPVGSIVMYPSTTMPDTKWLLCDGSSILQASYPALYALCGVRFGAAAANYFKLPDMRANMTYGASVDGDVGATGGAATHTLSTAEIPTHTHPTYRSTAVGSVANYAVRAASTFAVADGVTKGTGGGGAHNNLPPYLRLTHMIKALP